MARRGGAAARCGLAGRAKEERWYVGWANISTLELLFHGSSAGSPTRRASAQHGKHIVASPLVPRRRCARFTVDAHERLDCGSIQVKLEGFCENITCFPRLWVDFCSIEGPFCKKPWIMHDLSRPLPIRWSRIRRDVATLPPHLLVQETY